MLQSEFCHLVKHLHTLKYQNTWLNRGASICILLSPKCAKNHLHPSVITEICQGVIPLKRGWGGERKRVGGDETGQGGGCHGS